MKDKTYFNVSGQVVSIGPNAALKIEGNYRTADSRFIQVHDTNVAAAEGAVPKKSWPISGGTTADPVPFFQTFTSAALECVNGMYICISSTDGTKTIDSSAKMDLFVELESEDPYLGASVVGDLTTGKTTQGLTPSKRLRRVEFQSSDVDAGTLYIQLHIPVHSADGAVPFMCWPLPQNTTSPIVKTFGYAGVLLGSDAGNLIVSSTPTVLTTVATQVCLKAILTAP